MGTMQDVLLVDLAGSVTGEFEGKHARRHHDYGLANTVGAAIAQRHVCR